MKHQENLDAVDQAKTANQAEVKKPVLTAESWKPFLAFAFIAIIVFDFIIAPAYMGSMRMSMDELVTAIATLPDDVQKEILEANFKPWKPITLSDGVGMFYIAIGAILTGVAVTRSGVTNAPGK